MGGLMGGWMGLIVFLVLATLVVGIALVVTAFSERGDRQARKSVDRDPQDILAERYAKGEIDREEFEERRQTLQAPSRSRIRRPT
ncbi:MAG TPA: SHOCT domain-containing protein [Actinomycetota bacterium]|nr:SHOCT domain-containing protein [Actinomycetota bacterium]